MNIIINGKPRSLELIQKDVGSVCRAYGKFEPAFTADTVQALLDKIEELQKENRQYKAEEEQRNHEYTVLHGLD